MRTSAAPRIGDGNREHRGRIVADRRRVLPEAQTAATRWSCKNLRLESERVARDPTQTSEDPKPSRSVRDPHARLTLAPSSYDASRVPASLLGTR